MVMVYAVMLWATGLISNSATPVSLQCVSSLSAKNIYTQEGKIDRERERERDRQTDRQTQG